MERAASLARRSARRHPPHTGLPIRECGTGYFHGSKWPRPRYSTSLALPLGWARSQPQDRKRSQEPLSVRQWTCAPRLCRLNCDGPQHRCRPLNYSRRHCSGVLGPVFKVVFFALEAAASRCRRRPSRRRLRGTWACAGSHPSCGSTGGKPSRSPFIWTVFERGLAAPAPPHCREFGSSGLRSKGAPSALRSRWLPNGSPGSRRAGA